MDEVKIENSSPEYERYLAERRKTVNSVIGLVMVLGLALIACGTIIVLTLANNGVFNG